MTLSVEKVVWWAMVGGGWRTLYTDEHVLFVL